MIIIYEIKMEGLGTFEVKSTLLPYSLIKYIASKAGELDTDDNKVPNEINEEILKNCFKGFRILGETEWNPNYDEVPGVIILSYLTELYSQSKKQTELVIKTEKNSLVP